MNAGTLVALACCLCWATAGMTAEFLGKIAFLRDGNLWVQDLPDGAPSQVTTSGKALNPTWSASGHWLKYLEGATTRIVDVQHPRTIQRIPGGMMGTQWSPVEDTLAYTKRGGGLFLTRAGAWRERRLLAGLPAGRIGPKYDVYQYGIGGLRWSPDGKSIAYVQFRTGRRTAQNEFGRIAELYRINTDGSGRKLLLRIPDGSYYPLLQGWTPDGKYILFLKDLAYGASIVADGVPFCAIPVGGAVREFTSNTPADGGFTISPDSRQLAVIQRPGRESWKNAQLDVSPISRVARRPLTGKAQAPLFPAWSPHWNELAYTTGPAAPQVEQPTDATAVIAKRHVVLVDPATGAVRVDTRTNDSRDEYPLWTADGNHLLFMRITQQGQAGVWAMERTGKRSHQVVERIGNNEAEDTNRQGFYGTVDWQGILGWWPGQRLTQRGLLFGTSMYIPVRPVIEGLGGTLQYDAKQHSITMSLNGKTLTRALQTDAHNAYRPYGIWSVDGTTYLHPQELWPMKLQVSWNAPAGEAVITNNAGHRTVILPTRSAPLLRAKTGRTAALASMGKDASYLVGGIARGRYLIDDEMAPFLHGRERYTLYTPTGMVGMARGSRPKEDKDAYGQEIIFRPRVRRAKYALSAPWNALPHPVTLDNPSRRVYRQMVLEVLDAHGLPREGKVTVHQAMACDLNGDGRTEYLISASRQSRTYYESPKRGDCSFVALRMGGKTRTIVGDFFPAALPLHTPNHYELGALLDVDGDGRQEVIVKYLAYEGDGDVVFRVQDDDFFNLFSNYCGLTLVQKRLFPQTGLIE